MPDLERAEAPRPLHQSQSDVLVRSLQAVRMGRLVILLEIPKLSPGSPIDVFVN